MPGSMIARRRLLLVLAVAAVACVLAGCGGDEPVTVGEGQIPGSVPDDFPIPNEAVVGSTLVDRASHRTEFSLNIPRDVTGVTQYYLVNLVSAGFVVERSTGDDARWSIKFSRDTLRGTVLIESAGPGAATAAVSINRS